MQLFSAIESYSENSEIRYVGGCVRKALNNEILDDIDLAVNLKPNECIEALNKKLNGENSEEVDKWLTKEHQKLQEEFEFIAKTNVGTEFMSDEDIEKVKQIAKREWVRHFDDKLGLSHIELQNLPKEKFNESIEGLKKDKTIKSTLELVIYTNSEEFDKL